MDIERIESDLRAVSTKAENLSELLFHRRKPQHMDMNIVRLDLANTLLMIRDLTESVRELAAAMQEGKS